MNNDVIQPMLIEEPKRLDGRAVHEAFTHAWHLADEGYARAGIPRPLGPVPWPGIRKEDKEQYEAMAAWLNERFIEPLQREIDDLKAQAKSSSHSE